MVFRDQNYLLLCDRNLWHQLRIYVLLRKYGLHVTDEIIINDDRYYNFRKANFAANIHDINKKITDEGLKHLTNAQLQLTFSVVKT